MKEKYESLQSDFKSLQEKNAIIETKLNNTGQLLKDLRLGFEQPQKVLLTIGHLETLLTDNTETTIGSSITLEISKLIPQGSHNITVDKFKFQLEWNRTEDQLQLEIYTIEQHPSMQGWSCDFVAKTELQPKTQENGSVVPVTSHDHISYNLLAVICCGNVQNCSGKDSDGDKIFAGHAKVHSFNCDVSLTLMFQPHQHVLTYEVSALTKRSHTANLSSLQHLFTCKCYCHHRAMSISSSSVRAHKKGDKV